LIHFTSISNSESDVIVNSEVNESETQGTQGVFILQQKSQTFLNHLQQNDYLAEKFNFKSAITIVCY